MTFQLYPRLEQTRAAYAIDVEGFTAQSASNGRWWCKLDCEFEQSARIVTKYRWPPNFWRNKWIRTKGAATNPMELYAPRTVVGGLPAKICTCHINLEVNPWTWRQTLYWYPVFVNRALSSRVLSFLTSSTTLWRIRKRTGRYPVERPSNGTSIKDRVWPWKGYVRPFIDVEN